MLKKHIDKRQHQRQRIDVIIQLSHLKRLPERTSVFLSVLDIFQTRCSQCRNVVYITESKYVNYIYLYRYIYYIKLKSNQTLKNIYILSMNTKI